MCGRFTSTTSSSDLAAYFESETDLINEEPNFNVTPTSDIRVVREDDNGQRRIDLLSWGLVPQWAESPAMGSRLINARSETVAEKPSFRSAFRHRRCLIPVDGFYEWVALPGSSKKCPVYVSAKDSHPLAFAGIWETWKNRNFDGQDGDSHELHSCAIITGPPNELLRPLHDRMPMILERPQWSEWLRTDERSVPFLESLLMPASESLLQWWPVSTNVNNGRLHDASLIEPVEITPDGQAEGQGTLL
ncbi:MAG: SOS response-associated peptidase [Acidimicrobiales bacterium]